MRLMRALPGYVVSTNDMTGAVRGYLKEVILSVRFLSVRFSNEYLFSVTRKKLYKDVCDVVLPEPLYRAMYAGGEGKDVLKRVKRMQVAPGAKYFFFQAAHRYIISQDISSRPWFLLTLGDKLPYL